MLQEVKKAGNKKKYLGYPQRQPLRRGSKTEKKDRKGGLPAKKSKKLRKSKTDGYGCGLSLSCNKKNCSGCGGAGYRRHGPHQFVVIDLSRD